MAGLRGAAVSRIAAKLAMHDTALVRNLRVLEARGWVSIEVGTDRRQRLVDLTPAGRDAFAQALPLWPRAQKQVESVLADGVAEMNARLLDLTRQVA